MGTMDDELPDLRYICINPGEIHYYENKCTLLDIYRTTGGSEYEFLFKQQDDGSFRTEVIRQPDYGSRDTDLHKTHRFKDGKYYYVCWDTPLYNLAEAKQVAAEWAKQTDRYIKTGKPF